MGFRLRYGNYIHGDGECELSIARDALLNEAGYQYGVRERWVVTGYKKGSSPAELYAALMTLEAAYSIPYQSAALLDGNGNVTVHTLAGVSLLGGVKVVKRPSFPQGGKAEYTTFRYYEIELECDYPVGGAAPLLSWTESVVTIGTGGPRYVVRQPLIGPPISQVVATNTPMLAIQSGEAVGVLAYPPIPPPIWPAVEHQDKRRIERVSPKRTGPSFTGWKVSWSYEFESPVPIWGIPGKWV